MERIWLKSYRADVPAEADVDAFTNIPMKQMTHQAA
jgi:hypothetical protein